MVAFVEDFPSRESRQAVAKIEQELLSSHSRSFAPAKPYGTGRRLVFRGSESSIAQSAVREPLFLKLHDERDRATDVGDLVIENALIRLICRES